MSASHDADAGKLCSVATVIVQCVLFADWPKTKSKAEVYRNVISSVGI